MLSMKLSGILCVGEIGDEMAGTPLGHLNTKYDSYSIALVHPHTVVAHKVRRF